MEIYFMNNKKENYLLVKYFGGKILLKLNKTKTKIKKMLLFYPSDIIKKFQISKRKFLISFDVYDEIFKKTESISIINHYGICRHKRQCRKRKQ